MDRKIWEISDDVVIVNVGSPKGRERYSYEHYHSRDSVFRGNLLHQITLSKSQFRAVLAVLKDIGVKVKYLGGRR